MIQNYDTNGLVFALNYDRSKASDEEIYGKSVLNILRAQNFRCIPLVDNPRIRKNTNNLRDRAVYRDGGKVTHIARRRIYNDENEIVIIPAEKIAHIQEDADLFEALILLFSPRKDEDICDFIVSVGGTKEHPIALFTLREALQESTRNVIFTRMAKQGIVTGDKTLTEYSYLVYNELDKLSQTDDRKQVNSILEKIRLEMAKVDHDIDERNTRISEQFDSGTFADLQVKDIMQMVACGIDIKDDKKVIDLAKRILCNANDFTRLAVYSNGKLDSNRILTVSKQDTSPSVSAETTLTVRELIKKIDPKLKSKDVYAIIEPDKNIITSEGEMVYPGFLTMQELRSPRALLSYAATCAMIEYQMIKVIKAHGINSFTVQDRTKNVKEATLGEIITFVTSSNSIGNRMYDIFHMFSGKVGPNDLRSLIPVRNEIVHNSLITCFGREYAPATINLNNLKLIYNIGECLKLYK